MSDHDCLQRDYDKFFAQATRLAGSLTDLAQRATVYHHIYKASEGNHAFPLIAAHGALWAGGYFRWTMKLAKLLSLQYAYSNQVRVEKLAQLNDFANAFREINRRVCVDIYTNFHFTALHGTKSQAAEIVPVDLLEALNHVHAAIRAGKKLSDAGKRQVFLAHFLNEQQHIVGPAIEKALNAFDWPLVKWMALKPPVRFAYFPKPQLLWFHNFAKREKRIERGLNAFAIARDRGWSFTENALRQYQVLPQAFFADPVTYFVTFRTQVLEAGEVSAIA